jgi:hypothetical protein
MGIKGIVTLDLVHDGQTIRLVHKNLTVERGYALLGKYMIGSEEDVEKLTYIAIGTGGHVPGDPTTPIPPLSSDTQLETELGRAQIYLFETPNTRTIKLRTTIENSVAQGDITEAGIFTESNVMFARVTFPAVHKAFPWYLIISWEIQFSEGVEA